MYNLDRDECKTLLRDAEAVAPHLGVSKAVAVYVFIQARAAGAMTAEELKAHLKEQQRIMVESLQCRGREAP